jgi:hypothetical protein
MHFPPINEEHNALATFSTELATEAVLPSRILPAINVLPQPSGHARGPVLGVVGL